MKKTIKDFINDSHSIAKEKGWYDEPKTFGELIALIHSELSEALEEYRNGKKPDETYYSGKIKLKKDCNSSIVLSAATTEKDTHMFSAAKTILCTKPEGIPSELADVVIRVFDLCGAYNIDLEAAIEEKLKYNRTRAIRHGGKKL